MPGTTPNNALRYPLATEAPDGPGGFLALATDVDNLLGSGPWAPTLGGTGAAIGANPVVTGSWSRIGKHVSAKARIIFGSSASFGTGTPTLGGLPATIVPQHSNGYGLMFPGANGTGTPVVFLFRGVDGANMEIRVIRSQAAASMADAPLAWSWGAPAQSSELHLTLDLTSV